MLVDQLTINDAAGAHSTLTGLLVVVALAVVIVLPPLGYLLWLTQTEKWSRASPAGGRRTGFYGAGPVTAGVTSTMSCLVNGCPLCSLWSAIAHSRFISGM